MKCLYRFLLLFSFLLSSSHLAFATPVQFLGAETGTGIDEAHSFSGLSALTTSPVKTGAYAYDLKATTSGNSGMQLRCVGASGFEATCNVTNANYKFDLQFLSLPNATQGSSVILYAEDTSFNPKGELWVNSSGNLLVKNNAGVTLSTGATVLTTGVWYQIELLLGTGASATYTLKINGTQEFTGTGALATGGMAQTTFGPRTTLSNGTFEFYVDDIVIDDAAFPGAVYVKRMGPLAAGSTQVCKDETGASTPNISKISDIPSVTSTFWKTTGAASDVCLMTLQTTATSGISGTIKAAKPWISRHEVAGGSITSAQKIRVRESATNVDNTARNLTNSTIEQGFNLLTTKPSGGAWTTSALDGTEIGILEGNAVVTSIIDGGMMVLSDNAATATPTPTATATATATATPTSTPTATATPTATPTPAAAAYMSLSGIGK